MAAHSPLHIKILFELHFASEKGIGKMPTPLSLSRLYQADHIPFGSCFRMKKQEPPFPFPQGKQASLGIAQKKEAKRLLFIFPGI